MFNLNSFLRHHDAWSGELVPVGWISQTSRRLTRVNFSVWLKFWESLSSYEWNLIHLTNFIQNMSPLGTQKRVKKYFSMSLCRLWKMKKKTVPFSVMWINVIFYDQVNQPFLLFFYESISFWWVSQIWHIVMSDTCWILLANFTFAVLQWSCYNGYVSFGLSVILFLSKGRPLTETLLKGVFWL